MRGSYAAELLKLRKRSAGWVLLGASLVLSLTFGYLLPYLGYVTGDPNQQTEGIPAEQVLASVLPEAVVANTIGGFPVFSGALALVLGALVIGGEYGWGTLKTILTQRPRRLAVLGAQLLALATALLGWVLAIFAASAVSGAAIALAEGRAMTWPSTVDIGAGLAAGWLVLVVWCLAGALLGTVLRGVALPIGLGVVWVLGVEALISGVVASLLPNLEVLADVLPGVNAGSLVAAVTGSAPGEPPPGVTDAVSGGRALLTLLCYAAVFVAASALAVRRRDVI
jgi:ABC-2 type transport system permease protein